MSDFTPSAEQEAIFQWFKDGRGNLIINAFAGTGKTTTVTTAAEYAPEPRILMTTFGKDAKAELEQKVRSANVEVKNFHGLAFAALRNAYRNLRVDDNRGFDLARAALRNTAVARRQAGKAAPVVNEPPTQIVSLVCKLAGKGKNMLVEDAAGLADVAEDFDHLPDDEWSEKGFDLEFVCEATAEAMRLALDLSSGKIDFDDMIWLPVKMNLIQRRFPLVILDEAQDTNECQLQIALRSVTKDGRIVVVGDRRQAIFRFRGAGSNTMDRLKQELKASELSLSTTYRCPKKVVELAAQIVPGYRAAPQAPEGEVRSAKRESLPKLVGPKDFVISRKNAPLVSVCLAILRSGKRAKILGRDIGAGLIALVESFKARSIPEFAQKLNSWEKRMTARAVRAARTPEQGEAKAAEVADKADTLRSLCEGLSGMKELNTRISDLFADGAEKAPQVVCSTIHKIKGKESENVFVLADTLWQRRAGSDQPIPVEEENCAYIAYTRSKQTLTLVSDK